MLIAEEDLQFVLKAVYDGEAVRRALDEQAKLADQAAKAAWSPMIKAMSQASHEAASRVTAEKTVQQAAAQVTTEIQRQREELTRLAALGGLDPALLRERVETERQVTDLKHRQRMDELRAGMDPAETTERLRREQELTALSKQRQLAEAETRPHAALDPNTAGREASVGATENLRSLRDELTRLQARQGIDPALLRQQVEAERQVTDLKHRQLLDELRAGTDPQGVQDRVRREREMVEFHRQEADLEARERLKQEGTAPTRPVTPGVNYAGAASGLAAHKAELEQLRALEDPAILRERLRLDNEIARVQHDIAEEGARQQQLAGDYSRELANQKAQLLEIRKASDPAFLKERLRLDQETAQARRDLAEAEAKVRPNLEAQRDTLSQIRILEDPTGLRERLALQRQITAEQAKLAEAELRGSSTPAALRERLAAERQLAALRHAQTVDEARMRQDPAVLREQVAARREVARTEQGGLGRTFRLFGVGRDLRTGEQREEYGQANALERYLRAREAGQGRIGAALGTAGSMVGQALGGTPGGAAVGKAVADSLTGFFGRLFGGGHGVPGLLGMIYGQGAGGGRLGAVGGGIGAAFGGAPGAFVGKSIGEAVGAIPDVLGTVLAAPARLATAGLRAVAGGLRELQGSLGPVGAGLEALGDTLETVSSVVKAIPIVGSVLGPLTDTLAGVPGIIKDITGSLVSMAEVASPGSFKQWSLVLRDVQGVIGARFLPVLELMRDGVRLVGDALATLLPDFGEVRGALSEFRMAFGEMGTELRTILDEIGPTIRQFLIDGLKQLSHWLAVAAKAVTILAGKFRDFLLGAGPRVPAEAGEGYRSSVGAAASPAHIGGIDEYLRQLQQAAFSEGTGASAAERTVLGLDALKLSVDKEATDLITAITTTYENTKKWLTEEYEEGRKIFDEKWKQVEAIATALSNIATVVTNIYNLIPQGTGNAVGDVMSFARGDVTGVLNIGAGTVKQKLINLLSGR